MKHKLLPIILMFFVLGLYFIGVVSLSQMEHDTHVACPLANIGATNCPSATQAVALMTHHLDMLASIVTSFIQMDALLLGLIVVLSVGILFTRQDLFWLWSGYLYFRKVLYEQTSFYKRRRQIQKWLAQCSTLIDRLRLRVTLFLFNSDFI
ncbi:MAG: hypothetical protein COT81_05195 [Candidatus Buchananbacteria bacterium CG10_big_fil_rev_8_21_14_0_10_42_9]|uniref:Uncharacterized protein n=1 Tax=Candidatus Buchananbacteria bacterium CG10_big_fil_rev_8_21_14_0_10_42_9 TaxID=1974526 RepID=A0A2H0W051_9BACT|nr:MAG: hypothetical protein COT81_05195 [Candidatus Buchananbacteria bacterium CG10_big_fil_rev_8_21_14_0_10_42_9]